MMHTAEIRPALRLLALLLVTVAGCGSQNPVSPDASGKSSVTESGVSESSEHKFEVDGSVLHVYPEQELQAALDAAARSETIRTVCVHEGIYRPSRAGQAFIRFNTRHSGLTLEGDGNVTLTAANPDVASPVSKSFPAIVNHIVYFGDGVSAGTTMRGFRLTGANGYTHDQSQDGLEPNDHQPALKPGLFFYLDGGAIKIFGRSWPTIENMTFEDNFSSLCGAGISIEHRKLRGGQVAIRNCVFKNNNCDGTGAAVDVLEGSSVEIDNCLFVSNIANTGMDRISQQYGLTYNAEHGSGALTVFPGSVATVKSCTFTGNWNGVDDKGGKNIYRGCIFWQNNAGDGSRPGRPYEIDILDASGVTNCWLNGDIQDLRGTLSADMNHLEAHDPQFDETFVPRAAEYSGAGYRPVALTDH
jgi:hypothetical protein